eukprot:365065-Chlamydomonas_euryale.AAC.5
MAGMRSTTDPYSRARARAHAPCMPAPRPCHVSDTSAPTSCFGALALPCCWLLQITSAHKLYFNWRLVVFKGQVWRLFTNFLFFGNLGEHPVCFAGCLGVVWTLLEALLGAVWAFVRWVTVNQVERGAQRGLLRQPTVWEFAWRPLQGRSPHRKIHCETPTISTSNSHQPLPAASLTGLDFVMHMFFLLKYCKALEAGSFRGKSADFLFMLILGAWLFLYSNARPAWMAAPVRSWLSWVGNPIHTTTHHRRTPLPVSVCLPGAAVPLCLPPPPSTPPYRCASLRPVYCCASLHPSYRCASLPPPSPSLNTTHQ